MTEAARERVNLQVEQVQIDAHVWPGRGGWNASAQIGSREQRVMGAADREDALERLRESILGNAEIAYRLGIKTRRHWSPNPHWRGV